MKSVENAKITYVQLGYEDHGILTLMLGLEGDGWGVVLVGTLWIVMMRDLRREFRHKKDLNQ